MLIPLIEWLCSASVSFLAESWLLTWPHGIFMFRSCWTPVEPPVVLPLYDNGHGPPTTSLCSGPHWFRLSPNVHPKSYMMEHTSLMLESASGGFCMFLLPRPIQLQLSKWKLPTSNVAVEHAPFRSITYPSDKKPSMAIVVQGISKVHNLHLAQGINRICQSFPMIFLWFSGFPLHLGPKITTKINSSCSKAYSSGSRGRRSSQIKPLARQYHGMGWLVNQLATDNHYFLGVYWHESEGIKKLTINQQFGGFMNRVNWTLNESILFGPIDHESDGLNEH